MIKNKLPVALILSSILLLSFCKQGSKKESPDQRKESEQLSTSEVTKPVILFFGNSLTAGYQLDISEAFPALIERRLDSLGYPYSVINAGLSGETSAGGLNRIDWVLNTIPEIFVLELGANDALRGLDLNETEANLQAILDRVTKANPNVKIAILGMQVPPNLGQEYTGQFKELFPKLARLNNAALLPFLLEGVAGDPELNLEDGIHPTARGHKILAENVWQILEPLLTKSL